MKKNAFFLRHCVYKPSVKEPEWMRPLRKPTSKYLDLTDIVCKCVCVCVCVCGGGVVEEFLNLAQHKVEWWTCVDKAIYPRVPLQIWELLKRAMRLARLRIMNSDVLLTVHLNLFISVINQLDAQNITLKF